MKKIQQAQLFFITFLDELKNPKVNKTKPNDPFVELLKNVQKDEYVDDFANQIERYNIFDDLIIYKNKKLQCSIILNNFLQYNTSDLYIKLNIDENNPFDIDEFALFISGNNVLHKSFYKKKTLYQIISDLGLKIKEKNFLYTQLLKTEPSFPNEYQQGLSFIKDNKQRIHQLLLRSDTSHYDLRIENHAQNLESISNFYGAIDLTSPVHLIQFYQYDINSIIENSYIYNVNHRACWWLTITDIIFIQKQILQEVIEHIETKNSRNKKELVANLANLERILIKMKGFWHFEDMVHEVTKKVVNRVKHRLGHDGLLEKVQERVKSIENRALREINQEQNKQNDLLNIILLILAGLQIIPIIYEALEYMYNPEKILSVEIIIKWLQAASIAILIPIIVWKRNTLSRMIKIKFREN